MPISVKPFILYRSALTLVVLVMTVLAFSYAKMGDALRQVQSERDTVQAQLRAANAEIECLKAMTKPEYLPSGGVIYDFYRPRPSKRIFFAKGAVPVTNKPRLPAYSK